MGIGHNAHQKVNEGAQRIKQVRNEIWDATKYIFFLSIIGPVLAHSSTTFAASDGLPVTFIYHLLFSLPNYWPQIQVFLSGCLKPRLWCQWMRTNWKLCIGIFVGILAFMLKGGWIKNMIFGGIIGWSDHIKNLPDDGMFTWANVFRCIHITGLMSLRLVVALLLPFTSPVFAYLVARSMPAGKAWMGIFYMLLCSIPTGAIIWVLDNLFGGIYVACTFVFCCNKNAADVEKGPQAEQENDLDELDHWFFATRFGSWVADNGPFTWWVKPMMDTTFHSIDKTFKKLFPRTAAAAAILAGHFMIWSGPATTMYQRQFIPDLVTNMLIQPIGLLEDVAVILATWAGSNEQAQRMAEQALNGLVVIACIGSIIVLLVKYAARGCLMEKQNKFDWQRLAHRALTFVGAGFAIYWRMFHDNFMGITVSATSTATPTSTGAPSGSGYQEEHSDTKVMLLTAAFVTVTMMAWTFFSRVVVYWVCTCRFQAFMDSYALKEWKPDDTLTTGLLAGSINVAAA